MDSAELIKRTYYWDFIKLTFFSLKLFDETFERSASVQSILKEFFKSLRVKDSLIAQWTLFIEEAKINSLKSIRSNELKIWGLKRRTAWGEC